MIHFQVINPSNKAVLRFSGQLTMCVILFWAIWKVKKQYLIVNLNALIVVGAKKLNNSFYS